MCHLCDSTDVEVLSFHDCSSNINKQPAYDAIELTVEVRKSRACQFDRSQNSHTFKEMSSITAKSIYNQERHKHRQTD